jgi:D-alanyl-D-alanine carboxypeptidase/D-alanyl-D-alanine-endopeptidase (penicillin-binding protein 4)
MTLDSLLDAVSRTRGGTASACALRVRDGEVVWEKDSWRRMIPASTQKVLSAAALRSLLGKDAAFPTRLLRSGNLTNSVLSGNLVLEGGGDPAFGRGTDSGALDTLAKSLAARGIRHVKGSLVLRDPFLKSADQPWPGSWDFDNSLTDCDGAPSTGLSVDGNCPHDSSQTFPHRRTALAFRAALGRAGITASGPVRYELGTTSGSADTLLAAHASPHLDSLLRWALWKSSNHDMETFALIAGKDDPLSSRQNGLRMVRQKLVLMGLDTLRTDLADLSGLSRKNAMSTGAMARLLAAISRNAELDIFPLLPGPGEGTLKVRFKRTLPDGTHLRAKTGSLDGVSALVGRLAPPQGDTLVFALFFQGHAGAAAPIRFAQDQIVGVLAGGPVIAPLPTDTAAPAPRPAKPPRPRPAFLNP